MIEGSDSILFKESYYNHLYENNEFSNRKYFDLIALNSKKESTGDYWLAGRCVMLRDIECFFGVQRIDSNGEKVKVNGDILQHSMNPAEKGDTGNHAIRPMISIDLRKNKCTMTTEYRRRRKCKNM